MHLEPAIDENYKIDLDNFLSEKHKNMVNRNKMEGNIDHEELVKSYCEARDKEKNQKNKKQKIAQELKSIMVKNSAEEIDFGSKGKVVWGRTFNVRYIDKDEKELNF